MLTTVPMEFFSIVVLREKSEDVMSCLLGLGVFHPVDIRDVDTELKGMSTTQIEKEYTDLDVLDKKQEDIIKKLKISTDAEVDITELTYTDVRDFINNLEERLQSVLTKKAELQMDLKTKESLASQVKEYFSMPVKHGTFYTFLEVALGRIDAKSIPALEKGLNSVPHVIYPFRSEGSKVFTLVIGLKRDRALVEKVLKDLAWEKVEHPKEHEIMPKDAVEKLSSEIFEYHEKIKRIEEEIKKIGENCRAYLSKAHAFIALKKSIFSAKRYSFSTEKTVLLSGWIPLEEKGRSIKELKKIADVSYIELKNPEEMRINKEEVPVKLRNNFLVRPFELLINVYGIPRYGSIDPTIFVAVSFLLMFGAMFGDLGHGLVFCFGGLSLWKAKKEYLKQAAYLLFYCGVASSIFGVLYGSFFGKEFESLWINPHRDIMEGFKVSIFFGIGIISAGIIVNIVNAIRDRDYFKILFDKTGLISGIVYWAGIGLVIRLLVNKTGIPVLYLTLICGGILLLFLKPFIKGFFEEREEGLFVSLIESLIDILEVVMGFLANTVSFIRVAAFSLAHAGLFIAIFELSRLLHGIGGGVPSILMLVIGNIFVIVLEGLVVCIQSLRLNYYEFFSKFFMTGKRAYEPLKV